MKPTAPSPRIARPTPRILAVLALVLLPLLGLGSPALAHDTLVSTDPEDGAELQTSPEDVTLSFSDDVMSVSPVIRIVDADGEIVADTAPEIAGPEATISLEAPLAQGEYTVQWRVVSSDGHPIEGDFTFTVLTGPAPVDDVASDGGDSATTATPSDAGGATPSPEASPETTEEGGTGALVPVFIGLGVIAVIAVIIGLRAGRGAKS